ncbi:cytidylate kinase [Candidatus Magnetoovum chiemensis]|nr:cytidylate kinase [Candidatus Magnetoovum chiemensis]
MYKVIAIDGPSGSGKSTIAKRLAEILGFNYLDTGALYRAAALKLHLCKVTEDDASDENITSVLKSTTINYNNSSICLDGKDVSNEIRDPLIGYLASVFAGKPPVRNFLLTIQREQANNSNIIVEGRDTTTVVFPKAWKKFYLTADPSTRVNRRYEQLKDKNITKTQADKDIKERDKKDTTREVSPLKQAPDAILIDTSSLTIAEVLENILNILNHK